MGILATIGRGMSRLGNYFAGPFADNGYQWAGGYWGDVVGRQTVSGEMVGPETAMALPVYFACLRNLSEDSAKLPIAVYKRLAGNKGREEAIDHPSNDLLQNPSEYVTGQQFREQLVAWALGWGHGEAVIRRDAGRPVRLDLVHPSKVTRMVDSAGGVFFKVRGMDGREKEYAFSDIITIEGFQRRSIAATMAENLGLNLAAQTFAGAYYGNGFGVSLAIKLPGALTEASADLARKSWKAAHGGPGKAHNPFITSEKTQFEKLSIPANEAQFLESRQFGAEQIATTFRMPTQKLGILKQAAGWSTVEGLETAYVTDTLMPWNVKLESEFARKLLFPSEQKTHYVRVTVQGLLRGDVTARTAFYEKMYALGVLCTDDIRALEELNPVEGGDQRFRSTNLVPLVGELDPVEPEPVTAPEPEDAGDAPEEADPAPEAAHRQLVILSQTKINAAQMARVVSREAKAIGSHVGKTAMQFTSWADDYFRECDGYVADMVMPACESLALLAGGDASHVVPFVAGYCATSAQAAKAAHVAGAIPALITQWTVSKPSHESAKLVELIVGGKP